MTERKRPGACLGCRCRRFVRAWAAYDGNSPGYNRQKAALYGGIAYTERKRRRQCCASIRRLRARAEAAERDVVREKTEQGGQG